ncbi:MAG: glycosyltransferase family 2 protein, partial [Gammaproteobacteria bacterium]
MSELVTCSTILAVRNEALHIRRAIKSFVRLGIEVVIIDHESTDGTLEICKEYLGDGVLTIEQLAWDGVFDLSAQLDAKACIARDLPHDWIIHADADEWFLSPVSGESLREGINRIDRQGYNVINFEEFVFLPNPDESGISPDYEKKILYYYYFAPRQKRLMRAWKRKCEFNNRSTGGHQLIGAGLKVAPEAFILRHYITLSQQHAYKKYVGRVFSDADLQRGWHGNRLNIDTETLNL